MLYLDSSVVNRYNNANRQLQKRAYSTMILLDELMGNLSMNVSSLIRSDTPHNDGRSIDVNKYVNFGNWVHVGKNTTSYNLFNNINFIDRVKTWCSYRWLNQFICPYYLIDSRLPNLITYSSKKLTLGELILSHQTHFHVTFAQL